jgi:hypothetical protein
MITYHYINIPNLENINTLIAHSQLNPVCGASAHIVNLIFKQLEPISKNGFWSKV